MDAEQIILNAMPDASSAVQDTDRLRTAIAAGRALRLDLDGALPTQVALQILFAACRSAEARGIPVDLGDNAALEVSRITPPASEGASA